MKKKSTKNIYVFFDLDRTLLAQDSMLLFCNYVIKKERIRAFFLLLFLPALILYLFHIINTLHLKKIFFSFLFRIPLYTLLDYAKDFVKNDLTPYFFPEILKKIEYHKKLGHRLILNTASIDLYVKYIAQQLEFSSYHATKIELQKTMPLIPTIKQNNVGQTKVEVMKNFLPESIIKNTSQKKKIKTITRIPGAYTYTDSISDLPLIYLAENITLVQPTQKRLLSLARKKNWVILQPQELVDKKFTLIKRFYFSFKQLIGIY